MLWVVQISAHSACTASRPRSRNCRNPRACLICPNTGSTICFRNRYAAITGALQLLPHFLRHLAADLERGLGRMLGSPGSDIGVDLPGRERQKIVLTAIARVRRNLPGLASEVGPDGIDQGNKLRTVAHALRQSMRHDDLLGPVDRRLRVLALRDRRLERVEAIVERQQSMPSEGDDHGLFLPGQDR